MKKLYILLTLIILGAGVTELFHLNTKKSKNSTSQVKASLFNTNAVKTSVKKAELSNEKKEELFEKYIADVYSSIAGDKPTLAAFKQAMLVYHNLKNEVNPDKSNLLTVIDFSLPSTEKRLWILDLEKKAVLKNTVVSHGKNSGMNMATKFSNEVNSYMSSLGAYKTAETYVGKHGLSLRLDGLEEGINDNARKRAIVLHTATYADPEVINLQGRLGRSLGCPAIPLEEIDIIENISGGSILYIHSDNEEYALNTEFNSIDNAYQEIANIKSI